MCILASWHIDEHAWLIKEILRDCEKRPQAANEGHRALLKRRAVDIALSYEELKSRFAPFIIGLPNLESPMEIANCLLQSESTVQDDPECRDFPPEEIPDSDSDGSDSECE